MTRRCIFCSGTDLTREHVIAQWLSAAMPQAGQRLTVNFDHAVNEAREWTVTDFDIVTKRVCARCNNGWMSALEGAAQPILTPMIHGAGITLITPEEAATVATWAVKTTITFLAIENEPSPLLDEPARWLAASHQAAPYRWQPPEYAWVWLGARTIDQRAAFARTHIKPLAGGASTLLLTLGVGYLVVQAALPMRDGQPAMMRISDGPSLVRIWPLFRFWPPPSGPLDDGEFIDLPEPRT